MHLSPDQMIFWQHGLFKLNGTIVTTWALMAVLAVGAKLATRRLAHLEREALELIGVQARRQTLQALDPAAIAGFSQALRERRIDPATVATRARALANADFRSSKSAPPC